MVQEGLKLTLDANLNHECLLVLVGLGIRVKTYTGCKAHGSVSDLT